VQRALRVRHETARMITVIGRPNFRSSADEYEMGSASRLRLRMGALAHVHLWPVSRRGGLRRGTPGYRVAARVTAGPA
jgi:hypothetical protein